MTRFLRAAFLLLAMLSFGTAANAGHAVSLNPHFRHFTTAALARAAGGSTYIKTNGETAGYIDSLTTFWNSSAGQPALVADTTEWFSIPNLSDGNGVGVGADSLSLMTVALYPSYFRSTDGVAANSSAADSVTVTLQGSFNGTDAVAGVAIDLVENVSSNCFERVFNFARNSQATFTNIQLGYFPLYRIIWKDFTGTTGDYATKATWFQEP